MSLYIRPVNELINTRHDPPTCSLSVLCRQLPLVPFISILYIQEDSLGIREVFRSILSGKSNRISPLFQNHIGVSGLPETSEVFKSLSINFMEMAFHLVHSAFPGIAS